MLARSEDMPPPAGRAPGREQLDLFRALPGDLAPRDAQDLMAYPFFSLAKSRRLAPIDFRAGSIAIRVEAVPEHGMATIWDADVLIWAASQIVHARDAGLRTSRLMAATPYEILTFVGRGAGARDYQRLRAGLDRLQSTTVATSIRRAGRTSPPSLLLDQRVEGNGRPQRAGARDRIDPAGLVLRRRPRRRTRADHRPGLFLTDRRARALALSRRPQTWRSSGLRLELRLRPSPRQVRQPLAAQAFRLRHSRHRSPPTAAGLQPRRSNVPRQARSGSPSNPRPSIRWPKRRVAASSQPRAGDKL